MLEKYLNIGKTWWFLDTIQISDTYTVYKEPAMVDGFLVVLAYLSQKYPQNREAQIPSFKDVQEAKIWMVQQYVIQLEEKNKNWELTMLQEGKYEKEVQEYKKILEENNPEDIDMMAWISMLFVPQRWQEIKNKNPHMMPHTILMQALQYIPKNTDMIFNDINADDMKSFVVEHKEKIHTILPLLEMLSDDTTIHQENILENLLLCSPNPNVVKELVDLATVWKQKNDYYEFIYRLNNEIIWQLNNGSQNPWAAKDQILSKERIQGDIKSMHDEWVSVGLKMIESQNVSVLPNGYTYLSDFIKKNPEISLTSMLKEV